MKIEQASLLIVDDNEMNRDMLSRRLERKGYTVTIAEDGNQALGFIERHGFDLVLLDIMMPDIDGFEVLRVIRQTYSAIELPIIMVTGKDDSEDIVQALEAGANDYVTKPIDFPVVFARTQTHLSLKRIEEARCQSEERYALAVRGARDGLWDWNLKTNEIYYAPRWKEMLGYEENEIGNHPDEWFNRVHPDDVDSVKTAIAAHLERDSPYYDSEYRVMHKDGRYCWMLSRGTALWDESGNPYRFAGSQTDITEGKVADTLTGLPNRILFMDRLERIIERSKRDKNHLFSLLLLDLDRFKTINDSLGHQIGDQLLIQLSRRLESCIRSGDNIARLDSGPFVARLGGDAFLILLDGIKHESDPVRVAERIHKELAKPFNLSGHQVFITASLGIVLSTMAIYRQPEDLLGEVEIAMHRAKSRGKACHEIFDKSMHTEITSRLRLESDLWQAIEAQAFDIYYQPIVSLRTGQITGCEALLRWHHPDRGFISPAVFIPVAEDIGAIMPIGEWVLKTACRQHKMWRESGYEQLQMAVNVSVRQFQHQNIAQLIKNALKENSMSPNILKVEITESISGIDIDFTIAILNTLSALGVQISMDDFGTGYSSLSHLMRLPVNIVKIDKSFVKDIAAYSDKASLASAIIAMAHRLNLKVIAEGVETEEQLRFLRSHGCDEIQGYLFSRPVPAEAFTQLLETGKCLPP